jgi:hypothetical protein
MTGAADEAWPAMDSAPTAPPQQDVGADAGFDEAASWAEALNQQQGAGDPTLDGTAAGQPDALAGADAPPLVPGAPDDPLLEQHVGQDVETLAALRQARQASGRRWRVKPSVTVVILLLIVFNAALINWRTDVVRAFPQTASLFAAIGLPVNLRGLEFANVAVSREQHEGVPVLVVEGLIISIAKAPVEVPRLRLAIKNESGGEIYSWTALPSRSILAPGEQLPFRSRLASPPADGREVLVRFFHRHDLATGTR